MAKSKKAAGAATTAKAGKAAPAAAPTVEEEVSAHDLLSRIKALAEEGRVKRIRITEPDGDIVLDVPLAVGALAGGALVVAAPVLALIGVIAGLATKVKLEITRDDQKKG
jgi:hypothetical protein